MIARARSPYGPPWQGDGHGLFLIELETYVKDGVGLGLFVNRYEIYRACGETCPIDLCNYDA